MRSGKATSLSKEQQHDLASKGVVVSAYLNKQPEWTDAEDRLLRALWGADFTTREIASQIGNRSHNAVAARANRLHLPSRHSPIQRTPQQKSDMQWIKDAQAKAEERERQRLLAMPNPMAYAMDAPLWMREALLGAVRARDGWRATRDIRQLRERGLVDVASDYLNGFGLNVRDRLKGMADAP